MLQLLLQLFNLLWTQGTFLINSQFGVGYNLGLQVLMWLWWCYIYCRKIIPCFAILSYTEKTWRVTTCQCQLFSQWIEKTEETATNMRDLDDLWQLTQQLDWNVAVIVFFHLLLLNFCLCLLPPTRQKPKTCFTMPQAHLNHHSTNTFSSHSHLHRHIQTNFSLV